MLIPGEQTEIELTITINNSTAHRLNTSREVLEDILILRLENGRDYYISVTGKYARSCFGMPVDELVLYTAPIREVPLDPILRSENHKLDTQQRVKILFIPCRIKPVRPIQLNWTSIQNH